MAAETAETLREHSPLHRALHGDWSKRAEVAQVLGLIAIPISIIVLLVSIYQFEDAQRTTARQALSQQEASARQQLDEQRQATLAGYLDQMSVLILDHHLLNSLPGDAVRALAVADTDTAVRNLDGKRKGILLRYLWESGLIIGANPIIPLDRVDLSGADLVRANLSQVNLDGSDLAGADLAGAYPNGAMLQGATLAGADLRNANLGCVRIDLAITQGVGGPAANGTCGSRTGADLNGADLRSADLRGAGLCGATLLGAHLERARLSGARYNPRPFQVQVNETFLLVKPTQWPRGFRPLRKGAAPASEAQC